MMDKPIQKRALICGVGGQDGTYLAQLLISKGYHVIGTSRDANNQHFIGLTLLNIIEKIEIVSMALSDFRSVLQTVSLHQPDEIYNLSGQSSVGLSFDQPVETIESISIGTLNLLESIRFVNKSIRLYSAGSSECFGDTGEHHANELTPFRPRSPYAVAKACAHNLIANYRESYGMHASTGILFNHESPLRPERFVTQKIIKGAFRISQGELDILKLGRLDIHRDWGWAPEYVDAMWRILQQDYPDDYVIATGRTASLENFVELAFSYFQLDWRAHVSHDSSFLRPSDIRFGAGDPTRAFERLGWKAIVSLEEIIKNMCISASIYNKN